MVKDIGWKAFLSDDERYADLINGIGCGGLQVVDKTDLHEMDTQTGMLQGLRFIRSLPIRAKGRTLQIRDAVRKTAFGMNFAIIGVENQELIDYEIPLRNLSYDVGEYEKQARKIRKEVRAHSVGLSLGEFLYGFRKDSRLYPVVTPGTGRCACMISWIFRIFRRSSAGWRLIIRSIWLKSVNSKTPKYSGQM